MGIYCNENVLSFRNFKLYNSIYSLFNNYGLDLVYFITDSQFQNIYIKKKYVRKCTFEQVHPERLISLHIHTVRLCAVCQKKLWVLSYPKRTQLITQIRHFFFFFFFFSTKKFCYSFISTQNICCGYSLEASH